MAKRRLFSIYSKVFFYTLLILLFVIAVMFFFFSDQIKAAVESTQRLQISGIFQPLLLELGGKSDEEIISAAGRFHEKNTSFEFRIESSDGRTLYQTDNFTIPETDLGDPADNNLIINQNILTNGAFGLMTQNPDKRYHFISVTTGGVRLYVSGTVPGADVYNTFIGKAAVAFALLLLASVLAAALFARRIAKPIRKIAGDTQRMASLEPVEAPAFRRDEIGQLASDVHRMYGTLQRTITQLEIEIRRRKEMEDNQRYFFSAASHELKTPVAAAGALLEGMLENVIEPSEYPKYLRECLKLMGEQNRLASEILELVTLDGALVPEKERTNLKQAVDTPLAVFKTLADAKGLCLQTDVPEDLLCALDPRLFGRAFSNVVMNAVQNTSSKGRLFITALETGDRICLTVFNEGAHIREELLPKLFEPFYRADAARSRGDSHSGLGLAIVRRALDLMRIPFALENTAGGVLFRMELEKA